MKICNKRDLNLKVCRGCEHSIPHKKEIYKYINGNQSCTDLGVCYRFPDDIIKVQCVECSQEEGGNKNEVTS